MSSEVKSKLNASNIECLRPGGGASKKTELPNVIDMEETNWQVGVNIVEGYFFIG